MSTILEPIGHSPFPRSRAFTPVVRFGPQLGKVAGVAEEDRGRRRADIHPLRARTP